MSRSFTALVNPIAGGGVAARRWAAVAARLDDADVRVVPTRSREHAVESAATAVPQGRIPVAVGGDGLVRDVAQGVVETGGTMGIVPAGRGNDLARVLRFPTDAYGLAALLRGAHRELDVIDLAGTIVVGNVYCGVDSVANAMLNRSRWVPPRLLYRVAPVRAVLTWRAARFTLVLDGRQRTVRAHSVVVGNSGAYGHGLRIVPSAVMDDGRLDVLVVADGPRWAIATFLREARRGTHVRRPEVTVTAAREVRIAADRMLPVCGDGEELGELPARLRVRPAALRLLAPS